jgi:hypothetical protein
LGSVAAYETLCANPELPVTALVTLGSPLGTPNLIFDRLIPTPLTGRSSWPAGLKHWTKLADAGGVVALEKNPRFGDRARFVLVYTGSHAHDCSRYLTAKETGLAIARGLEDRGQIKTTTQKATDGRPINPLLQKRKSRRIYTQPAHFARKRS